MFDMILIVLLFLSIPLQSSSFIIFPEHSDFVHYSYGDTVRFHIDSGIVNITEIDIPVSLTSSTPVFALDFSFRYNDQHMMLDSVINLTPGLQYLYYFNPNDSVFRFTSNLLAPIPVNTALIYLRFRMFNGYICASDMESVITYINGNVCENEIAGCVFSSMQNEILHKRKILAYPNPVVHELTIEAEGGADIELINLTGQKLLSDVIPKSGITVVKLDYRFGNGIYILKIYTSEYTVTKNIFIQRN